MSTLCAFVTTLVLAQQTSNPADCEIAFAWDRSEVFWADNRWQLRAGDLWLKEFGRREMDAREAWRMIRTLKLTQVGRIGTPKPVIEYWLSDGKAPRLPPDRLRTISFDRSTLRTEQIQGHWYVRDSQKTLFSFGSQEEDAKSALAALTHYGFDQVGYVGYPVPSMMLFFATGSTVRGRAMETPKSQVERTNFWQSTKESKLSSGPNSMVQDRMPPALSARQLSVPPLQMLRQGDPSESIPIEVRVVEIKKEETGWKLKHGNLVLASFVEEREAREAKLIMEYYHFTELRRIGRPKPVCSYFLVGGNAPRGLRVGLHAEPFRPEQLRIAQQGKQWALLENDHVLLPLGEKEEDAQKVLQVIRHHRFNNICTKGHGPEALTFFMRNW